jgi:hypothetical protein
MTHKSSLPHFAQLAFERLQADNALRTTHTLDALLDSYASTYGTTCDEHLRENVHALCAQRFGASFVYVGIGIRL